MKVKTVALLITRDAMTILPSEVPEYELPIARHVFGDDNVEVVERDAPAFVEIESPDDEPQRLAAKWGQGRVEEALGPQFASQIRRDVRAAEFKEPKGAKVPA